MGGQRRSRGKVSGTSEPLAGPGESKGVEGQEAAFGCRRRDRGPTPSLRPPHRPCGTLRQALAGSGGPSPGPGLHPNTASPAADARWLPSSVSLNRVLRTWGQGITPLVGAGNRAGALVQPLGARASPGRVAGRVGGTWGWGEGSDWEGRLGRGTQTPENDAPGRT